jgi:hypothetical protein
VPDEAIYRCIEASCARSLPRRVNYCPYCGTAQYSTVKAIDAPLRENDRPHVVPGLGGSPAGTHAEPAGAAPADARDAAVRIARPPTATEWGASGRAWADPASAPQPGSAGPAARPGTPGPKGNRPASPARPPGRDPVRLRWWLLALAALWVVWFLAKPSSKKLDTRIDHAIALAAECKSREAQSELIALRSTRATQEQLQRVQEALNDAAAACRRQRQRQRNKSSGDNGRAERALAGAADGVARPVAKPGRQVATREHPMADDER